MYLVPYDFLVQSQVFLLNYVVVLVTQCCRSLLICYENLLQ